ncbi:conjugal transfer protein [Streptococcus panodentis]|uniref:Conjugal transfer protein n=1 Tax=Streptococcus panodentis TaxID=1581472 RepID=A0ABS5AUT3_9STRE|nr:conjugal transfer protein [Streptococcus panodentis]MBP2620330.1 conjugal transfer protein [Streptococcus panodentis]
MDKERIYDYKRGVNAPYWIQEIKTKKGTRIWYFATPMQVSFFVVFVLVLIVMLTYLNPILQPLNKLTHSISFTLYWYVPYKLSKLYTEYEPQGKKMHVFLLDWLRYFWEYRLNKKAIYQGKRVETYEKIVFEKTEI